MMTLLAIFVAYLFALAGGLWLGQKAGWLE